MSFLTPLYLLGLAAVSLPLIFHLIRRTPKGRYSFSSLMFLAPSPPRLTRRSRIDNWLLLLLRAAALILLAAAFARPFVRSMTQLGISDVASRKIAILVDTSASMQRDGIWPQVLQKADEVLGDLGPGDDVALYRFGTNHEALVPFDETSNLDPERKAALVRAAIEGATPDWSSSRLGDALVAVADELNQLGNTAGTDIQTIRQIILISDLQEGAHIDALQTYQWPDDVDLIVRPVSPATLTNAGLDWADTSEETPDDTLRVRVVNTRDSQRDQFSLHWEDSHGHSVGLEPTNVYVPSGETRVVRVPLPPLNEPADRLVLTGDDHSFDNTLFRVPLQQEQLQVLYIGNDSDDDQTGLHYYLARAFPETPRRQIQLASVTPGQFTTADLESATMIVLTASLPAEHTERLKDYMTAGGSVLLVAGGIDAAIFNAPLAIEEVQPEDYAMFGQIDFGNPLFAPFADPRFNDFTKIHFWRYRRLTLPGDWDGSVLARLDNGAPLLVQKDVGNGRVWLLAAGWNPKDSDLSRSSKFVPLLAGMLEQSTETSVVEPRYDVADSVKLPNRRDVSPAGSVRTPDGAILELAAGTDSFDETRLPGIYTLTLGDLTQQFAVNVPAEESRTDRMSIDELGQRGVAPGRPITRAEMADKLRQMRDLELESRQKLWQWLIVIALGVLIFETWLAGRLARIAVEPVETGT